LNCAAKSTGGSFELLGFALRFGSDRPMLWSALSLCALPQAILQTNGIITPTERAEPQNADGRQNAQGNRMFSSSEA